MIVSPLLLHFVAVGLALVMGGFGVAMAIKNGNAGAFMGLVRQQWAAAQTYQTLLLGMLFVEGSFILAFLFSLFPLLFPPAEITWATAFAELGASLALGIACVSVSLAIGKMLREATQSVARQPLMARKIQMFMGVLISLAETPVFFSLIIWLFIKNHITPGLTTVEGIKLCAAGLTMGLGSIGPSIGQALFTSKACIAIGLGREAYNKMLSLSMLTVALIETSALFAFVVTMFMILRKASPLLSVGMSAAFFASALAMGGGAFGASTSIGRVGGQAVVQTALRPDESGSLFSTALVSEVMIETHGLFAFVVALFILIKISL